MGGARAGSQQGERETEAALGAGDDSDLEEEPGMTRQE